jgi:Zn-dependent protease with chaperone function
VAAIVVAEAAVWLMRPRAETISPVPVSEHAYFSAAELQRASDFRDTQRLIGLGGLAVEGGVLAVLALWRPPPLRRIFDRASSRSILGGAAVGAGISLALAVTGLPLGALANERARDFGLSTQALVPWLGDQARAIGIGVVLAAFGGAAAMALLRRLGRHFWIGATLLVIGAAAVFTWLAPVVLAPVFNKFEPLPSGRTRSEVLALGRRAGVKIGQVYRVDASRRSTAINAYVDGLGPTKRVVLYDNTIRELSPAELRSVIAHELEHVKGNDVPRGLLFVALVAPLGMLFVQLSTTALARRRDDDPRSPAVLPALALSIAVAAFVLGVPGNQLSRAVEARADTFALELTHDPKAFIALQQRLAVSNLADPAPPAALQSLFGTHPTTMERIGAAVAYSAASSASAPSEESDVDPTSLPHPGAAGD